jgi:hypothetical protein
MCCLFDRLSVKDVPFLVWTLNEKDLNFKDIDINSFQVCNHFEGITNALTTKMGFSDLLNEMSWICHDKFEMSPRYENLSEI